MMATLLRLRAAVTLPVEADCISPDRFVGLRSAEVAALPLLCGRQRVPLGELFAVEGDGDADILIEGDLAHFKCIGQGMTEGRIAIHGNAGLHLGAHMSGGEIVIHGNSRAWTGAQMTGGVIRVHGDAGPMLGGTYPGEKRGMNGGSILVYGDAGARAGERMRRGLIAIQGQVGEFPGVRMIAGSLIVCGRLGPRPGAGMRRGSIVALGGLYAEAQEAQPVANTGSGLLSTFRYACRYHPTFLRLYLRRLQESGLPITDQHINGQFRRYVGDITTVGKGEILIYDQP